MQHDVKSANRESNGPRRRSAGKWLIIGAILLLAIAVPEGLYLLSESIGSRGGATVTLHRNATGTIR